MDRTVQRKQLKETINPLFFLRDTKTGETMIMGGRFTEESESDVPIIIKDIINERDIDEVTWVADAFVRKSDNSEEGDAILVHSETKDSTITLMKKYKTCEDGSIKFDKEMWDENKDWDGPYTGFFEIE